MDTISFTTFLKIGLMPTTLGKLGQLERMHNSKGGYDFYKQMKLASREFAQGKMSETEILTQIQSIKRASEREHNLLMATRFVDWWAGEKGEVAGSDRPSETYQTADMIFGIRLLPELCYIWDGSQYVTYLWATNLPKLTKQSAGTGLHMLRSSLNKGKFKGANFQILDLRQKKIFDESCITNKTPNILLADIALVNSIWADVAQKIP